MPLVGLQCVIVVFPDHTHILFALVLYLKSLQLILLTGYLEHVLPLKVVLIDVGARFFVSFQIMKNWRWGIILDTKENIFFS